MAVTAKSSPDAECGARGAMVVTGASSGIGRAVAVQLASLGHPLALTARREGPLEDTAAACRAAGVEVRVVPADLREGAAVEEVISGSGRHFGTLAGLVHAAGVARFAPVSSGDPDHWREMLEVNVLAFARASRASLPWFPAGGGHVVVVSSMSGHRVPPGGGFYASTKFGVRALAEALRSELRAAGSATRVTAVSPGFVDTPLLDIYFEGREGLADLRASGTALSPDDVAAAVVHALEAPPHVDVNDILLRSARQFT